MWKIIKADIQYHKWLFLSLYLFVLPFYVFNAITGNMEDQLMWIAFYTLPIIGIFRGNEEKHSKRIRFHASLPISTHQLGISRYVIISVYWISLVCLFCISVILNKASILNVWWILSMTASGPFVASCMMIYEDLKFSKYHKAAQILYRVVIVLLGAIIIILYATYAFRIFNTNLNAIFKIPLGAIVLVLSTMVLVTISVRLFESRRAYVA